MQDIINNLIINEQIIFFLIRISPIIILLFLIKNFALSWKIWDLNYYLKEINNNLSEINKKLSKIENNNEHKDEN